MVSSSCQHSQQNIAKQRDKERECLHRWLLYATCGSAIAHILLLGISIKSNTLLVMPQETPPEAIDLTLLTTAEPAEAEKLTETTQAVEANASSPSELVVAISPLPQERKVNQTVTPTANKPAEQPANSPLKPETRVESNPASQPLPQEQSPIQEASQVTSKETAIPDSQAPETPATAFNPSSDQPQNQSQTANQGTAPAISSVNSSSINSFSDRIRNLLRGNSPNSNPSTDTTPQSPEPAQPQRVQCIRCDKPQYPTEARNRGLQGQARVAVDVDANGNVINVRIINSSGHAELDEAAVRQARQWKFTPSASGRQGIGAKVDFQLEGSEYQRQRQRERQTEVVKTQPASALEVAKQESPQPAKPEVVKGEPVPELARQAVPPPSEPKVEQNPLPVIAQPEPVAPAPPPVAPVVPANPPSVESPQQIEND